VQLGGAVLLRLLDGVGTFLRVFAVLRVDQQADVGQDRPCGQQSYKQATTGIVQVAQQMHIEPAG